jgi:hypothetical protein
MDSEIDPASVNLDEDPVIRLKEVIEPINPESPELVQAALILDYCGEKGDDLKTKLEKCNAGTYCTLLAKIINATNICASQKFWSYNAADMALFV